MQAFRTMLGSLIGAVCLAVLLASVQMGIADDSGGTVPLKLALPKPISGSWVISSRTPPNLEPPSYRQRPEFMVPAATSNLSLGRSVTSSDLTPLMGELPQLTDGKKDAAESCVVELGPGLQWVQIDLGVSATIYAVAIWHDFTSPRIVNDVIVQIDADSSAGVRTQTVFNNDHDNTAGFGNGKDNAYYESFTGRLVDAMGVTGRYVRLYSNGNSSNDRNQYLEVEVYGVPVATE